MPQISQVHIDVPLTNFSLMYANEESQFVADQVFPVLSVAKRSDKYFTYPIETLLTPSPLDAQNQPLSLRRPGSTSNEIDYAVSSDSYYCDQYALSAIVTDEEVAYSDAPLSPDMDQVRVLVDKIKLDIEMQVAKKVGLATNYPSGFTTTLTGGASGTSWYEYDSTASDPFANIQTAIGKVISGCVSAPNSFLMDGQTSRVLVDHPDIKDAYKYTHQDLLTLSGLPKVIRGLQVIESDLQYNSAAAGAAYSGSWLWRTSVGANGIALIYYKGQPGIRSKSFGFQFEGPDETTGARGWSVRRWRNEARSGNMVEVRTTRDFKFICVDSTGDTVAGYLYAEPIVNA